MPNDCAVKRKPIHHWTFVDLAGRCVNRLPLLEALQNQAA
jgi:hypothetical protein